MQINRVYLPTIGSTNTWAKVHARELDPKALTVIVADEQTAGRGRFKRSWISPKGCNLYVTYVFFCQEISSEIGNLPQILALAAYDVIAPLAAEEVRIKWPNDLLLAGKKLGGILCEVTEINNQNAVVIGLGLNINMPKSILDQIDRPAISLMEFFKMAQDKEKISEAIHQNFHKYLQIFLTSGFKSFLEPFKNAILHQRGDLIRFSNFESVVEGYFEGINSDGSLSLRFSDGSIKRFTSGELL